MQQFDTGGVRFARKERILGEVHRERQTEQVRFGHHRRQGGRFVADKAFREGLQPFGKRNVLRHPSLQGLRILNVLQFLS
mgnify:CR=1 FL=1